MSNLARAKTVRRRMSWILSREGAMPRVSGLFLKYMIQAVMFFRAETWVATTRMGTVLAGFQTQVTRRLTGQLLQRTTDGTWKYTSLAAAREAAAFLTMDEYVRRRQNTVSQYIGTRSLLDLCQESERSPGMRVGMRWWEQAGINLSGVREAAAAMD